MLKQTPKGDLLDLLTKRYPLAQTSVLEDLVTAKLLLMDTTYGDGILSTLQKNLKQFDPFSGQVDLFLWAEMRDAVIKCKVTSYVTQRLITDIPLQPFSLLP